MIEVKHLTKRYGNHVAVDDISFTIEQGKIYGFLGPNGAGKSTTMNMITGYLAATSGQVLIDGHDIFEEPEEAKKCIGYLPEMPPLYTDMTPKEYLEFVAELKGIPSKEREQMIIDVVEFTRIKDVAFRPIKNLSKGYRQRVGVAQAILGYPDVIILDEPTVGLDPKQIIEIRDLIKTLGKNHTVILSSHILSEVSAVCDEVIVIAHGKIVASDRVENLSQYVSGGNTTEFTIKGPEYKVKGIFSKMRKVAKYEIHSSTTPECVDVVATTRIDDDIREGVFRACAEADLPIMRMQASTLSLEDVFLKVTEGMATDHRPQDDEEPAAHGRAKKYEPVSVEELAERKGRRH